MIIDEFVCRRHYVQKENIELRSFTFFQVFGSFLFFFLITSIANRCIYLSMYLPSSAVILFKPLRKLMISIYKTGLVVFGQQFLCFFLLLYTSSILIQFLKTYAILPLNVCRSVSQLSQSCSSRLLIKYLSFSYYYIHYNSFVFAKNQWQFYCILQSKITGREIIFLVGFYDFFLFL